MTFLNRASNDNSEREPVEPLAGDYGEYVTYEGKLYGAGESHETLKVYKKNDKGEYEEVESYTLEGENMKLDNNKHLQVVGDSIHVHVENNSQDKQVYSFQDGEFNQIDETAHSNQYHFNDKLYYTDGNTLMAKSEGETSTVTELTDGNTDYTGSKVYYTDGSSVKTYDLLSGETETVYTGEVTGVEIFDNKLVVIQPSEVVVANLGGSTLTSLVGYETLPNVTGIRENDDGMYGYDYMGIVGEGYPRD
ncbi:hypothetical protein [Salibacterium halotolerans]|uniref:Uncharacterized protein n=1 Tax=Salibacterium halotolerans TaxID=1884432 RepID=A0A1I5Y3A0_9BACI|nr:hypothetical protein [Salibacterium halotolerans]SFQ38722.1 hypothetical protein SAMN05518683_1356 [Salibacterium halotolerans]